VAFLIPDNLKSRSDVPSNIKRVAGAFQVGLDENVTVWYEPLYDASGEKPHLVILLPDKGIVVLETLDIKAGGVLGVLRDKIRISRDGQEIEVENPIERAERLSKTLLKRIENENRLNGLKVPVSAGAIFPYLTVDAATKSGIDSIIPLNKCLFKAVIDSAIAGSGEAQLLRSFIKMFGEGELSAQEIPKDMETILRGIIHPEIVIDSDVQLNLFQPPEGGEDIIRVMDRKQEAFVKSLGEGHRVIRGVAGSGKTLILVKIARRLSGMYPKHRFLFTCYTKSLANLLSNLLKENQNVEVINLDKVMVKVIRKAGLDPPVYDEGDKAQENVAKLAISAIKRGARPKYRAVFLDEAQDFGTDALKFVTLLLEPEHQDLVIVADAAQNIFRRRFSWRDAGIQAQGRTRILRTNYRNTKEILEFAYSFLISSSTLRARHVPDPEDENAVIQPESAARTGPRPELKIVNDLDSEIKETINQVKVWLKNSSKPREIAVLYTFSNSSRANLLYEGLKNQDIDTFWLSENDEAKELLAEHTAPVILSTIDSSKGLEFLNVVLCGVWRRRMDSDDNRRLLYVGMTRAMDNLKIITKREAPFVDDLNKAVARFSK